MEKLKRFWKNFKLRMSLLRIWFMKNILLFIKVACVVCLVCILTGVITADTPVLGVLLYPFFAPLADEINQIIAEKKIDGLMTFFSVVISIMFSISMFAIKARSIAQTDIKSNKLKLAMIQANLYFNEDGKLVKKIEKATGEDINRDGKIDGEKAMNESGRKGIISGMFSAIQEFFTIMKADFSDDEKTESEYAKAIEDAGLDDAAEAVVEIDEIIVSGVNNVIIDKEVEATDNIIEDTKEDENLTEEEKVKKVGLLTKFKEWLSSKKKKKQEVSDNEVLENNMDNDAELTKEEEKHLEDIEEIIEDVKEVIEENKPTSKEQRQNDFLNQLRNRGK